MTDIKQLVIDVLEDRVDLKDLSDQQADSVIMALHSFGNQLVDSGQEEAGLSILDITAPLVEQIVLDVEEQSEQVINEALSRGCVYYEPEYPEIH